MAQYMVPLLMLAGLLVLFAPEAMPVIRAALKRLSKTPGPAPLDPDPVQVPEEPGSGISIHLSDADTEKVIHLSALLQMRNYLAGNVQSQEVIDSVLVPAIMRAGGAK